MRNRAVLSLVAFALVPAALLPGCEGMSSGEKKALGAGIGAVAGGLIGRKAGGNKNKVGGTIIGAVVGGVAGYLIAGSMGDDAPPEKKADPKFQQATKEFDAGAQAKQAGDDKAALKHYDQAAQLAPDQPEPYNNAGLIYLEQGDQAKAEECFRSALKADPNYEPARTNLEKMGKTV